MVSVYFSYALLALLATALLIAAYTDFRRREIDNWLNAAIALAAPLYWFTAGLTWVDVTFMVGQSILTFVVCCVLFVIRQMGGGDVKLLTALALWFAPLTFFQLVFMMGILGGGASVAMALFNMDRRPGEMARDGLAMLAGGLWVAACIAVAFAMVTGRSLLSASTSQALFGALSAPWLFTAIAIVVLVTFTLGLIHIMRRQKSRLPIPYGIAIAAAGLWILGHRAASSIGIGGVPG